ncbi:5-formyltetrahydrofolate cyclo-ligase [Litorilituus lipolyticus]|uniref:5-formyltetrahydrofolate cyclo-ligase n=1 Tax=Litorilituus lipolyticus TaxID=2491017 RepID=A0A502KZW7_9GAMM|nr:5-formyltetrahydrofolate cyclo-ligase [Litorilituus lipolyticus]TPH17208.1 5-formyltetrahydrofolate cyclo-ligase [Litorilituus lipolyticus]
MTEDLRTTLRKSIRSKRNQLTNASQLQASQNLTKQLTCHPNVLSAKRIAIYLTNDGELDPHPFIEWCWQQQKEVYLPVIHPFNKHNLLFLRYKSDTELIKNKFNINEPKLNVIDVCPSKKLDIIFTPLVAFDKNGARLGMGGGFYDRTLSSWYNNSTKSANYYPIGLAHDCQEVEQIPVECWDIPLPEIITPTKKLQTKVLSK